MNSYTLKDLGTADLMVYMAYDKGNTGPAGIAAGAVVCTTGKANIKEKQAIVEWRKNVALFANFFLMLNNLMLNMLLLDD